MKCHFFSQQKAICDRCLLNIFKSTTNNVWIEVWLSTEAKYMCLESIPEAQCGHLLETIRTTFHFAHLDLLHEHNLRLPWQLWGTTITTDTIYSCILKPYTIWKAFKFLSLNLMSEYWHIHILSLPFVNWNYTCHEHKM